MTPRSNTRGQRSRRHLGFTLLEIVLVLTVMGVLVAMAVPSFHLALEQARADVAGANLRAVWTAERFYWLDHQTYSSDLAELEALGLLDPAIVASTNFYSYAVASADAGTFTATATRTASSRWIGALSVDQTGVLSGSVNAAGESPIQPGFQ